MSRLLWIQGGHVIDPASNRDGEGDVFVREGVFAESLSGEEKQQAEVIDARGMVVCPGLVDIHVHLREPGQTHKETIGSGSRAAAAGGFTSLVCMPNTAPPADNVGTLRLIRESAARSAVVRVYPTGCITLGMLGEALAPIGSLQQAGAVAITDDGKCVQSNELMRRALEYAAMFNLPVLDHCQDEALTHGAVMNEGEWSLRLGLPGWPNAAEDIIVARNILLSHYTGAHVHLQHISSAQSVELVREAKRRGTRISAEATPHHLALTDACLHDYGTQYKMNPPLRTEADRQALVAGLLDGSIDCLATDHAPHTRDEKDHEFDAAPFGITGLETAVPITLQTLVREAGLALSRWVALWTTQPARLLGLPAGTLLPGRPADVTLLTPDECWTYASPLGSRASNSPWLGTELTGRAVRTIVGGETVWDGKEIIPPAL